MSSRWQREIIEDKIERVKSINFCISTPTNKSSVEELSANSSYVSGHELKKSLNLYLDFLKSRAKSDIIKAFTTKSELDLKKSEMDSISDIILSINEEKEYRMPSAILEKFKANDNA